MGLFEHAGNAFQSDDFGVCVSVFSDFTERSNHPVELLRGFDLVSKLT
jgi:hypothetical protein